ncbi:MAG: hypothetical protein ACYTFI_09460 [Planctomycetota bacterium]
MKRDRSAGLVLASVLLVAGCVGYPPGARGRLDPAASLCDGRQARSSRSDPPPPPSYSPPPPLDAYLPAPPRCRIGLGAGFMLSDGIGPGADLVGTAWFSELVGLRVSLGYYTIDREDGRESVVVVPLLIRAIFAAPPAPDQAYRKYWGFGISKHFVDEDDHEDEYHDLYYYPVTCPPEPADGEPWLCLIECGREYVLRDGSRLFTAIGLRLGDESGGLAFRMGIEFGG